MIKNTNFDIEIDSVMYEEIKQALIEMQDPDCQLHYETAEEQTKYIMSIINKY